jgi:hypothetical protein
VVAAQAVRDLSNRRDANSRFAAQQALTREQMAGQDRRADQTYQLQRDHYTATERQAAENARLQDEARREARAARDLSPGFRWVDENDRSKGQEFIPGGPADPRVRQEQAGRRPIPDSIVKLEAPEIEGLNTHRNNIQDIDGLIGQIDGGKLNLGFFDRTGAWIANSTNSSTESSRAVAEYQNTVSRLVNAALAAQKGTQTEGDAQRIGNEILSNLNDTAYVRQRLLTLRQMAARTAGQTQEQFQLRRRELGLPERDFSNFSIPDAPQAPEASASSPRGLPGQARGANANGARPSLDSFRRGGN